MADNKMKKIALIFVLMLLFSFAVIGQGRGNDGDSDSADDLEDTNVRKVNERLKDLPEVLKEIREANKERRELRREEIKDLRERLKACKENNDEVCEDLRTGSKLRIKHSLEKISSRVLDMLNSLKERVKDADIEDVDSALEKVNFAITSVELARDKVNGLTEESTKEEIKDAIADLKTALTGAMGVISDYNVKPVINDARLQNAIRRFNTLADNIEDRLSKFEERGYDFSGLKVLLSDLKGKIAAAETSFGEGDKVSTMDSLEDAKKLTLEIFKSFRANLANGPNQDDEDGKCESDADCSEGLVCIGGECEDRDEGDETECVEDSDCDGSKICKDGECEDANGDWVCTTNEDCEEREFCDEGECEDVEKNECASNDDCDDDEQCIEGECEDADDECAEDSDCEQGMVCEEGECEDITEVGDDDE